MRDIKVASRYAKSLLSIAIEEKVLEDVYNDMQLIHLVYNENRELAVLLNSPIVKPAKKAVILTQIFGNKISKLSNTFVSIIVSKKRESLLADIATSFIDIYKTHHNITTASVTTAIAMSKDQKDNLVKLLKSQGRESIDLKEIVNTDIIGGMILRIGDKQVDESIKRKLTNLEMEFDENPYIKEV
jgi:F-type H+-transporting ATPase subunit delta